MCLQLKLDIALRQCIEVIYLKKKCISHGKNMYVKSVLLFLISLLGIVMLLSHNTN